MVIPEACETDECEVKFEEDDVTEKAMFVQYYEGCLLVIDIASTVEQAREFQQEGLPRLEWQAIIPNPLASD